MKEIIQKAESHLANHLPFVVYRKPKSVVLQAFFMKDTNPVPTHFQQSGFCFFPFDIQKQNYFFELEKSDYITAEITKFERLQVTNKKINAIEEEKEEKQKYLQLLDKTIQLLKKGDFQKIVLSRPIQIQLKHINALIVFQKLLHQYPDAMVYIWFHPDEGIWIGATPETLVNYSPPHLQTMALAGTRVYNQSIKPDWSAKEYEEQSLVTHYIQEKLAHFSNHVKVSSRYTKQAGNLVHLNTDITANLNAKDLEKLILNLHPTPAVCGLPTENARAYIIQNEAYNRSFYTGFFGEINLPKEVSRSSSRRNQETLAIRKRNTETNLYVNLRCMKMENEKCMVYVGGGITSSSIPDQEWKETNDKSQTLLKVL